LALVGDVYLFPPPLYMSWPVFIRVLPLHRSLALDIYVLFPAQHVPAPPLQAFSVRIPFSSPVFFNCHITLSKMYSLTTVAALAILLSTTLAIEPPGSVSGLSLSWSEKFVGSTVNLNTNWKFWDGKPSNGEQETYPTSGANCNVTGGVLKITPANNGGQWTSCRLETLGHFSPRAGGKLHVEANIRLGSGLQLPNSQLQGIWPAFWSLGEGMRNGSGIPWPACGEIDTFENVNGAATGYGTIHCGDACHDTPSNAGLSAAVQFDRTSYHTWAHVVDLTNADWRAQSISFLLDGKPYKTVLGSDVGIQNVWTTLVGPMFMTLNVAVGGGWPGNAASSTTSGEAAGMEVAYVAVYEG
jgi:beta-glucanase (GH16 family)